MRRISCAVLVAIVTVTLAYRWCHDVNLSRAVVTSSAHEDLSRIIRRHVFVGVVTDTTSLIQHGTKLYLVNHVSLRSGGGENLWLYLLFA